MAIALNDNTRVLAPKPTDPRYFADDNTPWASVEAVEAGIPLTERHPELLVDVLGVIYWWKDDTWQITNPTPTLQSVLDHGNNSTTNVVMQTTDTIAIDSYSENNIGVYGSSNDSIGVLGNSGEGVGVQGYSLNNIASVFNLGSSNTNNITEWKKANQKVASISYDGKFTTKKSIKIDSDEPLDFKYLNGKVAFASLAEANTLIPIGIRSPYLTIVVAGVEYWWKDGEWVVKFVDLTTNQEIAGVKNFTDELKVTNPSTANSVRLATLSAPNGTDNMFLTVGNSEGEALFGYSDSPSGKIGFICLGGRDPSDFNISPLGNVGIGTGFSDFKLDVNGTVRMLSSLTLSNTAIPASGVASGGTRVYIKDTGSSTGAWRGRIVNGGENVAFLMGEYNSQAWLGAHSAALDAWADFYINPDGDKNVNIGKFAGVPLMTLNNSNGNVTFRSIPFYANDAAADADSALPIGSFYKITGSRVIYQKP